MSMDVLRIGLIIRALRRRRGWRQVDLAAAAGVSQSTVSDAERGHLDGLSVRAIRQLLNAVGTSLQLEVRWRGGALDRLMDERHSRLAGSCASRLIRWDWVVVPEVSYARYGERGSIDLLGWHPSTASLLVVEIKSEVTSIEGTLRKLDEKARLAISIARERFAWRTDHLGVVLVIADGATDRRRVAMHGALFDAALPARGSRLRAWLRHPTGPLRGIWFLALPRRRDGADRSATPDRVRCVAPCDHHGRRATGDDPPRTGHVGDK